ncbi:MAG: tetratricopeptide repeat protein, partial [Bacteroidales bacterium]
IQQGLAPEEAIRMYHLVAADLEMRQTNYQQAIPSLHEAINLTSNRQQRTRLTFILGQLYQEVKNYSDAQATYERILKMNPSFELAFQARIRMAMAYDPASGNSDAIHSELTRMLRDDKNKAFRDQIYYALAQMALRQGQQEEAIDLLLESTAASEENRLQKGLSFYHLAQIYYQKPDYLKASIYYDSTVTYLPQSFENFQQISTTRGMLSELAVNLRIIAVEDSLQQLAALPEQQRNEMVDQMIATMREQEALEREAERNRQLTRQSMAQTRRPGNQRDEGWYFYNPSSIAFGRTEFLSRFGERPLEDLWRISNKQVMAMGMEQQDAMGQQGDAEATAGGRFDRNNLLRNIPVTQEMMQQSNQRMAQAYYNAGLIFRDRFQDYQQAIKNFESLVSRFPDSPNVLYSLYYLYNLHRSEGNLSRAESVKNQIISKFPQSDFAQILGDPEYIENLKDQQQKASRLYQTAYAAYQSERYQEVLDHILMADSMELEPDLEARFAYLKALALGRMDLENEFRDQLQQVVQLYEGTPVHQPASVLLASRSADIAMTPARQQEVDNSGDEDDSSFSFQADAVHFFVMVIDVQQIDARSLRSFINEFNQENFTDREFSMSNIFLDDKNQLITLTNFENMNQGMEYYYQFIASEGLKEFNAGAMQAFLISVDNYPVFYQQKDIEAYQNFFQKRYLRN